MKKTILTLISGFFLITGAYAQSTANIYAVLSIDTLQLMNGIDLKTKEIKDNLGSYRKIVKLEDSTGHNYEYVKGSELQAIVLEVKEPRDGNYKRVEWYLDNGKEIYSESYWTNASGKIVDTQRVYINNDQLLAWFNSGKRIDFNSPSFKQLAKQVNAYAESLAVLASDVK